jgi:putative DNA methylase
MAIVAEGSTGRTYTAPTPEQQAALGSAKPAWAPEEELAYEPRAIWCTLYGLKKFRDLFTPRQLVALTTFSDLVGEARQQVLADAGRAGDPEAQAYADAVATYLALGVSRSANSICSLAIWSQSRDQSVNVFSRQALPMTWDFPEVNPFAGAAGDFAETMLSMSKTVAGVPHQSRATVSKVDASTFSKPSALVMIATDPPYYDNIGYADLSDFFYVWLRHSLVNIYQDLFSTLLAPKAQEIVASPYRFGGDKDKARRFFETGLGQAFSRMREAQNPDYPLTVYYAFKQAEDSDKGNEPNGGLASTGWETMLEGLLKSGFAITGTWPMRSERPTGVKSEVNALASSIVLVCRPRPASAPIATRRDFGRALQAELPAALRNLQRGNIAPVDFAQAAIGPGMAVFSRYAKVIEADGSAMPVRTALALINQALDQVLAEQEGEFDADTRWTVAWFEQHGMQEGPYGDAETLSKAKDTSVQGLANDGLLESRGGKVRLRRRDELPADWDPRTDNRLTVWEVTQHLVRRLEQGEEAAAQLLLQVGGMGETARDLAYRLYSICERKKWAQEALAYNSLVIAWPELTARAAQLPAEMVQGRTGM